MRVNSVSGGGAIGQRFGTTDSDIGYPTDTTWVCTTIAINCYSVADIPNSLSAGALPQAFWGFISRTVESPDFTSYRCCNSDADI